MSDGAIKRKNGGAFQVQIDPISEYQTYTAPTPERRLWAHVLLMGLRDATQDQHHGKEWLNAGDCSQKLGSYEWLCALLSINPNRLREELLRDAKKFYRRLPNFRRK